MWLLVISKKTAGFADVAVSYGGVKHHLLSPGNENPSSSSGEMLLLSYVLVVGLIFYAMLMLI